MHESLCSLTEGGDEFFSEGVGRSLGDGLAEAGVLSASRAAESSRAWNGSGSMLFH